MCLLLAAVYPEGIGAFYYGHSLSSFSAVAEGVIEATFEALEDGDCGVSDTGEAIPVSESTRSELDCNRVLHL